MSASWRSLSAASACVSRRLRRFFAIQPINRFIAPASHAGEERTALAFTAGRGPVPNVVVDIFSPSIGVYATSRMLDRRVGQSRFKQDFSSRRIAVPSRLSPAVGKHCRVSPCGNQLHGW
jgi:hypothetical protein